MTAARSESASSPEVREADLAGEDALAVARLVRAYLEQKEREKATYIHGTSADADEPFPSDYEAEVRSPIAAYADVRAYLAEVDATVTGVVILRSTSAGTEVKRLWADPVFRGMGVGSALIDAALRSSPSPVRLPVWDWRYDAVRLYASRGFVRVHSWDPRPRLVCMEHPG